MHGRLKWKACNTLSSRFLPGAAFRRASSMVGYLARSRHRPHLAHLASALHEQRMVLEMAQIKDSRRVRQHATCRDQALAEFYRVYEDLIELTRFWALPQGIA